MPTEEAVAPDTGSGGSDDSAGSFLSDFARVLGGPVSDSFANEVDAKEPDAAAAPAPGTTQQPAVPATAAPVEPTKSGAPVEAAKPADGASSDPAAPASPDPFAGWQPFSYDLNGQPTTVPGLLVSPEKDGAVIESPEALTDLSNRLVRGEQLDQAYRGLYQHANELYQLARLEVKKPDGTVDRVLEGPDAIRQLRIERDQALAGLGVVGRYFQRGQDGSMPLLERYYSDPGERERLSLALQLTERDIADKVRAELGQAVTAPQQQAQQQQQHGQAVSNAIDQLAQHFGMAEDVAAARQTFAPFVASLIRAATPDDARGNPGIKPGEPVVDLAKMVPWFTARAQERQASKQKADTEATARQTAAANAAKLAASTVPAKTGTRRPATPTATPAKPPADDWAAIQRAALAGRFHPSLSGTSE